MKSSKENNEKKNDKKGFKKKILIIGIIVIAIISIVFILLKRFHIVYSSFEFEYETEYKTSLSGEKYLKFSTNSNCINSNYYWFEFSKKKVVGDTLYLYFDANEYKDECSSYYGLSNYEIEIPMDNNETYDNIKAYYRITNEAFSSHGGTDKPIIYIYPLKEMDLTVKLGNESILTHTYPKYINSWSVHVDTNGNIYDYKTNKNYYALYWESIDDTLSNMSEGFVIEGKDTISFLEEKLEYLGLNEREINEFIIYWIDELENNKYNYIRFRTLDEINKHMPLEFSENPDTLIRIIMDFKPLDKKINVKEQKLTKVTRSGFTIVEWGGHELN